MKTRSLTLALAVVGLVLPLVASAQGAQQPKTQAPAKSATEQQVKPAAATHEYHGKSAMPRAPRVDLNAATQEELTKLPGITEELAGKIIAARPFKTRSELVSRHILTAGEFRKLESRVMVKPAPKSAK